MLIVRNILQHYLLFFVFVVAFVVLCLLAPSGIANGDIYLYAARAALDYPILGYHFGHAAVLWVAYHIVPTIYQYSILPAAWVSEIAGTISCFIVFHLLRLDGRRWLESVVGTVLYAATPVILFHFIIGETYALQVLFNFLFAYTFLIRKRFYATTFFFMGMLVSPLTVFGYSIVLAFRNTYARIWELLLVSSIALLAYFAITPFIRIDFIYEYNELVFKDSDLISISINIVRLIAIVSLNIGILIIYGIYRQVGAIWEDRDWHCLFAIIPNILLAALDPQFTVQYGAFQLPLLFILVFWFSQYISPKITTFHIITSLAILAIFFLMPASQVEYDLQNVSRLSRNKSNLWHAVGHWDFAFPASVLLSNWNVNEALKNYHNMSVPPADSDESALSSIFIFEKPTSLRYQLPDFMNHGMKDLIKQTENFKQKCDIFYDGRSIIAFGPCHRFLRTL